MKGKNIVIAVLLAAVVAMGVSLVFSPPNPGSGETAATTRAAQRVRIGVSIPAADHGWTAGVAWWAQRAMALHPEIEWQFATANTPEKQIADIQDMMAKGVDGLVILATESAPLTPIAVEAHERGIYIVNVDRGFLQPVADVFLEGDNKSFGRKAAQFIAQKLNGKGSIVILEGVPCTVNTDRVNAAIEVFRNYPGIKILARQSAMWTREKGLTVMQNFLTQFPHIDAVWAGDDDTALGAIQAITEAGRDKEMFVVGGGGMKQIIKMIADKNRLVPATITYPPSMIAEGIHLAASTLRDGHGKEVSQFVPRHMMIDVELVTPDNAGRYYFPDSAY
ncbi:MAG TPA: ABC transporter substrate-binding protein [Tepidisphaeraceae bacterium]|jgi:ribose transport system substrate-binding protein|nr:ABC transporter substrate-binding protein [Tepidisphaeraceae bacterium]